MAGRTHHAFSTKMAEYLGTGKELLVTEVPTLRACLRQGLLLQQEKLVMGEINHRVYPITKMMEEVADKVLAQWQKANVKFEPPVVIQKKALIKRLVESWKKVSDIAWGRITKSEMVKA